MWSPGFAFSLLLTAAQANEPMPPEAVAPAKPVAPAAAVAGPAHPQKLPAKPGDPPFNPATVPGELQPWTAWIAERLPWRACALVGDQTACTWPGALSLVLTDAGGSAQLDLHLDADLAVQLPGGAGAWPQGVRDGGAAVVVTSDGQHPTAWLKKGDHHLTWTIAWASRPNALALPVGTGVVALTLDGAPVPFPLIDDAGSLRLGANESAGPGENRLEVEVARRVEDGVPVRVTTRLQLRASGTAREVDLGKVTLAGTQPFAVEADLPVRLMPDGTLTAQLRPGTFVVTIEAVSGQPVTSLTAPTLPAPWPEQEVWAVKTDDRVRMVDLSGPVGVDPARTSLPSDWRGLPTFMVAPATPLAFAELRRGEPEPPPNGLTLHRDLWLDFDGSGLTLRDTFTGQMTRDWRLDVRGDAVLGHASDHSQDVVVTTRDGAPGVEVRRSAIELRAESRLEGRPSVLPAVGWSQDVQSLNSELHLPPGWTLLWASGVDMVAGPGGSWTLFDLFYVLVLALALTRLFDRRWGALALFALAFARHVADAPSVTWIALTVLLALERVVPPGAWGTAVRWTKNATLLALFSLLVPLSYTQLRQGLYPHLASSGGGYDDASLFDLSVRQSEMKLEAPSAAAPPAPQRAEEGADGSMDKGGYGRGLGGSAPKKSISKQVDPKAVVQTGPGVPTWSWSSWQLMWFGPVSRDQDIHMWLLGPFANLVLAWVRVGLLLALGLRMAGVQKLPSLRQAGPTLAALLALLLPWQAQAAPDDGLLSELEDRLVVRPACGDHCATAPLVTLTIEGETLVIDAEVHAADTTSWPLPGPASAWVPRTVELDGKTSWALARLDDGALHVRLEPGVHRVRATGPLPAADALALDFPVPPQRVTFVSTGWTIDGVKADGTVAGTVQLVRSTPAAAGAMSESLPPWLEVHRTLDLGIPWTVRTEITRVGPATQPVAVRVPLLPGESLTDEAFEVVDGQVQVTLKRDEGSVSWSSSLADTSPIKLTAPTGVPWTETWSLLCSPIFACDAQGPAPLQHLDGGAWAPSWRVWPGEQVVLTVSRPAGVDGQTITIDSAAFDWKPGLRLGEGMLTVNVRSSQGGRLPITLPAGAELRKVIIDGAERPIQLDDAGVIAAPLQPGATRMEVTWQQPHALGLFDRAPQVTLGAAAVNLKVTVHASSDRWILALRGPAWGPVPLFWGYLLLVLLSAPLLARLPYAPLRTAQWFLLGLGMTQVPVFVPIVVAMVFLAFGWRKAHPLQSWWMFDLSQLALVGAAFVGLICLYAAIHTGLLVQPDMQIEGAGSSGNTLIWMLDRTDGALPAPLVVSLPLWTFRVAMLLWALWLASSLVTWAPWVWGCWSDGGIWRGKAKDAPAAPPEPPAA